MKYSDGSEARLGDRVRIRNGDLGRIVISIDTDEFAPGYPPSDWKSLRSGVLVLTDKGALVRFVDPLEPGLLGRVET